MNQMKDERYTTKPTEIDRILATEEALIPSSGFLASVMERVTEEAAAPPPIPFPWKRAVPGMIVAAGVLGWSAIELVRYGIAAAPGLSLAQPHLPPSLLRPLEQAGWVALALGCSLASWVFSQRLTRRSDLL